MTKFYITIFIFSLLVGVLIPADFGLASVTDGTIDSTYKYAWGENIGWINFGTTEGNVHITDSELTGYAWGENIGWISLNCSNDNSCSTADYKVSNDGEGNLSGYAWSENTGWINFNPTYGGVTIDSSGEFSGYAWGENIGWIVFNCSTTNSCDTVDYKVKTDWRPQSVRPACNNSLDDDGDGKIDYPNDPGCDSLDDTSEEIIGGGPPFAQSSGNSKYSVYIKSGKLSKGYIIDNEGLNFLLYINSQIQFKIEGTRSNFILKVVDLNTRDGKIRLEFNNRKNIKDINLKIKQKVSIDLDNDQKNDLDVFYNELKVNRIDLTLKKTNKSYSSISKNCQGFIEGDLVKEPYRPDVYLIENRKKRPIFDAHTFLSLGFKWEDIKEVDDLSKCPLGEMIWSPERKDTLIKDKEDSLKREFKKAIKCNYSFTRYLFLGEKGEDVRELQRFLNQNGFILVDKGFGSPGKETDFFGMLTKKALIKFQNYYADKILKPIGLKKGTGFLGPSTIKFLNSYCSK